MAENSLIQTFKQMRATRSLSDAALRALADVSLVKNMSSGQALWKMGDPGEFVAVVVGGCFEVNRLSSAGTEFCVALFGPSDVLGMIAVAQKKNYPGTARAFSKKAEVIKMYLRPVISRKDQPLALEISEWLREMILMHEQILRDKIDIMSAGRTEQKVFELLLQLNRRFGLKTSRIASTIPLTISKVQVSRLVEARVETVIRLFSRWKKKHLVNFDRTGIQILDWEELEKHIEPDRT